jgi:hypothetical protein
MNGGCKERKLELGRTGSNLELDTDIANLDSS